MSAAAAQRNPVEQMILHAVRAAAFRHAAAMYPKAADTFFSAANLNSLRAANMAAIVCDQAGEGEP